MMSTAKSPIMRQKQNTSIVLLVVLQSVVLGKWREDQHQTTICKRYSIYCHGFLPFTILHWSILHVHQKCKKNWSKHKDLEWHKLICPQAPVSGRVWRPIATPCGLIKFNLKWSWNNSLVSWKAENCWSTISIIKYLQ